ncbi:UDP-N-acetylmuramoylalanyl-D-glutamate-2,6-diaminopimelate ligase [Klebsormidium nitens]|uniref:UDP-N-acetylmuramoyl-L-alanyl-D-glutamate--2,6-diaminopimelate ligase MurE homolog, chloroplastic n=1 Tax=Klebsormidium nitens TaxID=105231 RepID=A0A1Y1IQK1_KLENI|nr:UDP-N-acetylmuramoylalanyl-D-glutamate-2,6-diaminopimelate ligase [Klebsormidium nitens]|eukprot:GAQ90408.1 UDP-N-acetylmuramoylalanyl-D-glutamate-2,6-diaminopimelate ligase [Klebsormidium nitens]
MGSRISNQTQVAEQGLFRRRCRRAQPLGIARATNAADAGREDGGDEGEEEAEDDYDEEGFDDDATFEEGDFDEFLEEVDEPEGEGGEILEEAALGSTEDRLGPSKPLSGVKAIEVGLVDVVKDDLDLEEAEELGTVEELEGNEGLIAADEEDDVAEAVYTEDYEEDAGSRGELVEEEEDEGGAAAAREQKYAAPPLNAVNLDVNQSVSYLDDDALDVEFDDAQEQFLDEVEEADYTIALGELLENAGVKPMLIEGDLDVEVFGITQDSRQVKEGDLFVCIKGLSTDGHLYAAEAVEKGASAVIASEEVLVGASCKAVVLVEDTTEILSALAGAFYREPSKKLTVVGITGTNGKTTTSYIVRGIIEEMGQQTGLLGTIAYYVGKKRLDAPNTTPDAIRTQQLMATMVEKDVSACVMEVSSHALQLGRVKEVDFNVAVFTNLTEDHRDFHGNMDNYREAKGKLFAKMTDPEWHRKVVNIDDPNAQWFISQGNPDVPVITFALEDESADVYPLNVVLSLFETELEIRTPYGNLQISSGLLGRHNIYNVMAAIAVGLAIGAPLEAIVKGVEEVDNVPGRMELIDEGQPFGVIVDYAHTPDALERLLDTVRECGPNRLITVLGCGGDRDRQKRPVMGKIATDKSEVTIFTSDNPRSEHPYQILDDMFKGVGWELDDYLTFGSENDFYPQLGNGHRLFAYDHRAVAVRSAIAMAQEGDCVIVAGKGHETYQIIGEERKYFDDREHCREALERLDLLRTSGIDSSELPWRTEYGESWEDEDEDIPKHDSADIAM